MFPFTIFCYLKENNIISVKAAKVLGYFNSLDGIPPSPLCVIVPFLQQKGYHSTTAASTYVCQIVN
jgi:hypothetical protein